MNKLIWPLPFLFFGCISKKITKQTADNQQASEIVQSKEIVYLTPDNSSLMIFAIIILGVTFFCFGLKYIPVFYKYIKGLTKKHK